MSLNNKILIIDDDQNLRKTLKEILILHHYEVADFSNGKQAIAEASETQFAIALIDLMLEDLPGLVVLRSIKEISPITECIITTGYASTDTAIEAINIGAYSYIQKPYDIDNLLLSITRAYERTTAREELLEAKDRYRQLYEGASDGILATDLEGNILDFNTAFVQLLGYSAEELKSKSFIDLTPEKYKKLEEGFVAQILEKGFSDIYEKEFIQKDGALVPVEISGYLSRDKQGQPAGMWGFIRDISERKNSEKKLQRQLMEATALRDVVSAGISTENIDQLVEIVTEIMGNSLYSDYFGVNYYDPKKRWLIPHYSYHGMDYELIKEGISVEKGITGRAVRSGNPQIVNNVTDDKDYLNWRSATKSEIAVPIIVNHEVFGVLNAESTEEDYYNQEDLSLLTSISRQMALAIERIQLRQHQLQRNKELSALYETSLAVSNIMEAQTLYEKVFLQIDRIFQPDAFLLALYDSFDESTTIAFAIEEGRPIPEFLNQRFDKEDSGLMGWIMNNKKSLRFADMTIEKLPVDSPQEGKPIRSWMGVPLINKGEVIGAISVQCFNADVYSESQQRLLESMAAQLAVALDNVRLIEQTKSQVERLAALHDIDTAINSSLDLRVIMNILLDQVIQRLQVDAAVVLLLDQHSRQLEFTAGRGFKTHEIEKYSIGVGENSSGQKALEQHLVQALDDGATGEKPGYAEIMQKEGFESFYSVPLIAKGQLKGVLDVFHRAPLNPAQDWFNFLETLAGQAAIAIDNTTLLEDLNNTNIDLTQAYDTTLEGWSRALDMRDHETEGHTRRVAEITVKIAREMGIPEHELIHIRRGALLHDIGKMGIPDKILLKPGPLDEQDWEIMHSHARRAYDLLYPIEYLRPALEVPLHHHEKFDGTGYPDGLKGNEIPLPARIFAVVDVWDALTSDRPYRKAWTTKKSLDYIKKQSGGHFDPEAVKVFLDLIQDELIDNKDIH
jgi:PAS domain S-box-containing protein/putative nucleotidyltransferase with HDIG domain